MNLKNEAYNVRLAAWETAMQELGTAPIFKRVEAVFGKDIITLRNEAETTARDYQNTLEYVLHLEAQMDSAEDDDAAAQIINRLVIANDQMAAEQVTMIKADVAYKKALKILGDAEERTKSRQMAIVAADPICQKYEQLRKERKAEQREFANYLLDLMVNPSRIDFDEITDSGTQNNLGMYYEEVRSAFRTYVRWMREASGEAKRIAAELNRFEGPYINEAPSTCESFYSRSNEVFGQGPDGTVVVKWIVTADGAAYLEMVKVERPVVRVANIPAGEHFFLHGRIVIKDNDGTVKRNGKVVPATRKDPAGVFLRVKKENTCQVIGLGKIVAEFPASAQVVF
ncbi:hypothetical protein KQH40_00850 [bacterium]|nr:hypothetical protein [bacterium]